MTSLAVELVHAQLHLPSRCRRHPGEALWIPLAWPCSLSGSVLTWQWHSKVSGCWTLSQPRNAIYQSPGSRWEQIVLAKNRHLKHCLGGDRSIRNLEAKSHRVIRAAAAGVGARGWKVPRNLTSHGELAHRDCLPSCAHRGPKPPARHDAWIKILEARDYFQVESMACCIGGDTRFCFWRIF